jgi:hypothetical protein
MDLMGELRRYLTMPRLRPWALATPLLVLIFCLPMLRPLRHPDPRQISDDESARLATIQALAEHRTLDTGNSAFPRVYNDQPPMMALLLAGPYGMMERLGLTFARNPALTAYLLTLLGVTLPVAGAAGLIYRMGRLFELPRWKRAVLACGVVFGSGLVSYAVVLNAYAPAAALVIAAVACLVQAPTGNRKAVAAGWLALAGFCAALAGAIEPAALLLVTLLIAFILSMRWRVSMRLAGVAIYLIGAAIPLIVDATLRPPIIDRHWSVILAVGAMGRLADALWGAHGAFSHFPVLLLAIIGIAAVMHRHWPMSTKVLAAVTGSWAAAVALRCCATPPGAGSMFAAGSFVIFLPLLVFWAGAWFRRRHRAVSWALASVLVAFSVAVSLIGATDPLPRIGYDHYSAAQALAKLIHPPSIKGPTILAGG